MNKKMTAKEFAAYTGKLNRQEKAFQVLLKALFEECKGFNKSACLLSRLPQAEPLANELTSELLSEKDSHQQALIVAKLGRLIDACKAGDLYMAVVNWYYNKNGTCILTVSQHTFIEHKEFKLRSGESSNCLLQYLHESAEFNRFIIKHYGQVWCNLYKSAMVPDSCRATACDIGNFIENAGGHTSQCGINHKGTDIYIRTWHFNGN